MTQGCCVILSLVGLSRGGTPHFHFHMEQGSVTVLLTYVGKPVLVHMASNVSPAAQDVSHGSCWRALGRDSVQASYDRCPCLFQMHFIFSDEAVLLFDFWRVHSPTGKNWEGQTCRWASL